MSTVNCMNIWISEFIVKTSTFFATYISSDNMYCDWRGRIFTSLNKLRHKVMLRVFVIILIAWHKKAKIYVYWANAVSYTSNTRSRKLSKLFTSDSQQWGGRLWWKTGVWTRFIWWYIRNLQVSKGTARRINYEQRLLEMLKEKSEHVDGHKAFLLSLVFT